MSKAVAQRPTNITIDQRIYVNGFPKSGTHMAEAMISCLASPVNDTGWAGTFRDNAWSLRWIDANVQKFIDRLTPKPRDDGTVESDWPAGGYLKGHAGHTPELAQAFRDAGVSMIFMYRDLRDVAVSAAFHVLDERVAEDGKDKLKHPDKAAYRKLYERGGFERVLIAQIRGYKHLAGVVQRWHLYAGWMREGWVCKVPYEYMRENTAETAHVLVKYVTAFTLGHMGYNPNVELGGADETVQRMVAATRDGSATFRRGQPGNWREHWTPRVERVFEACGGNAVLKELGYQV